MQPDKTESGKQKAEIGASSWSASRPGSPRADATSKEKLKCGKLKAEIGPDHSEAGRPGRRSAARRGGGMGKLGPVGDSWRANLGEKLKTETLKAEIERAGG